MRCALLILLLLATTPPASARTLPSGAGFSVNLPDAATVAALYPMEQDPAARAILRIDVRPGEVSGPSGGSIAAGRATLDAALSAADGRARVVLAILPDAPSEGPPTDLEAWLARVTEMARVAKGRVAAFEIADGATCFGSLSDDSFALKKTILAIRLAEPDAAIAFVAGLGGLAGGSCPPGTADSLSPADVELLWPFLDALATEGPAASPLARVLLSAPPAGMPVWRHDLGFAADESPWQRLLGARLSDAPLATSPAGVPSASTGKAAAEFTRALETLARAIPADAQRIDASTTPLTLPEGVSMPSALMVVASDLSQRLVFGPAPDSVRSRGRLAAASLPDRLATPRIIDPAGTLDGPLQQVTEAAGVTSFLLPLADRPLVLAWDRAGSADEVSSDLGVDASREPSLEEILARHAQRTASRQGQVTSWSADLTTTMRYSLGASGRSIEVRIESRYFERADGLKEIENLRYFIDGAPYAPKNGRPPELPLMQPDKVSVVPLEVHLDKSYKYELRGKDQRDGRSAWRVGFKPITAKADAWSGTAWIDAETFDLLGTDATQTGLEAPVLSNQQQETHGAVGEGGAAWLVKKLDVRRVMSLLGSNVVVDIQGTFTNHRINESAFDTNLEQARASDHQMLRDTDAGLKYLRKDESGVRVPVEAGTRKLFFIAGARVDDSLGSGVIPLAGVNILETNAWDKGLQVNAFIAGAINSLSISDPSVGGGKTNLTLSGFLPFVRQVDRVRGIDDVNEDTEAAVREPQVSIAVGHPIGPYVQGILEARVSHQSWSETDNTIATFQVPESTWLGSLIGSLELHGGGWDGRIAVERSERSSWERWGPEDALGNPTIESPSAYWKWRGLLKRDFHLTPLQTLGFEGEYLGGENLDRFSQYEFAAFGGPQLPGFEGSGIHFDEAAIVRAQWSFSVLGRLGADLKLVAARTRDELLTPAEVAAIGFEGTQVGFGAGATFPGPWRTVVRVEIGVALSSPDHDGVAGDVSGQFIFTKLLK